MKKTYKIEVDCANCANLMENEAKKTEGVANAVVNFMTCLLYTSFRVHEADIKSEVLAAEVVYNEVKGYAKEWKINSESVTLGVEKFS